MLKGKNLWILLGVGAVAYYYWMQKKKSDAAAAASTASVAFTGDLNVPQYQNAGGSRYTKKKLQFGAPAGEYGNVDMLYTPLGR
jgi:hypothetical protein